jgi:Concanavalin A-like lectin/glucanases superfamily/Immunoglobulin I-set domain
MKPLPENSGTGMLQSGLIKLSLCRLLKGGLTALTMLACADLSSGQTLQSAGDLILNLQSVDLNGTSVWTNQTLNVNGVGNLTTLNASPLNVVNMGYGSGSINALYVNGTVGNAVQSLNQTPSEILGNAPFSGEAWIYADNLNGQDVMSYGFEGGSAAPAEVRDMGYFNQGYGAFTGNFGNSDSGWNPPATAGAWHYLAWTYDGTTVTVYQDAVPSGTGGSPLNTQPSLLTVGCNISQGGAFNGYIAAARIESGVLSASQITNNFLAGPFATFGLVANKPFVSPGTNVFLGDVVTFAEFAQAGGQLTYQWYSDNGTGGATFSPISGQTATNYVLNTSALPGTGTYQYEVVVTGGTTVTSPPAILVVNAASAPIISQNTTPLSPSNIYVGANLSFSAAFVGNQIINYQWQKSTDSGVTFQGISGANATTLSLTNLQVSDSGQYRLHASNGIGAGNSTPAILTVLATRPLLQVAGQLLVNLQASDLNPNGNIWTNEIDGMGDFITVGNSNLSVTNLFYDNQPIQALVVNQIQGNSVQSLNNVPDQLLGNSTYSAEAWVYATAIGNGYEVAYGVDGGGGAPHEARELGYGTASYQGFTGNFGPDVGWSTSPSVGWHYLVATFDGSTVQLYQDGQPNGSGSGSLNTPQTLMWIGSSVLGGSPFAGCVASARVQSGVLTPSQVANNYASGPNQAIAIVVSPATVSPGSTVFIGDSVTLSVTNVQSLQQSLTYQWQTDNGSGGESWNNISGATGTNYTFTAATAGTNEYQLVVTGTGAVASSAPAILTIKPQAAPAVSMDTSPSSASLFAGQQIIFTASFSGNQPITNQWQVSTDGGATFQNINGATGTSLTITNLQASNSGKYRLKASNGVGSGFSTPATLTVQPASARPQAQVAGDLIANLQSQDLTPGSQSWINRTYSQNSVGDFTGLSTTTANLSVTNLMYGLQPIQVLNVNGTTGNAVESENPVPNEIIGNSPYSAEAWIYATSVAGNFVVGYGLDGGGSNPHEAREMGYLNQGYGAFTGNFGPDIGWSAQTVGWHYIVATFDGSTVSVYQDGQLSGTVAGSLNTQQTLLCVGSSQGGNSPFVGYVASARVESGVLTAGQIAQNYATGPDGTVSPSSLVPLSFTNVGGVLTLNWTPSSAAILLQSTNLLGPWVTNSSASAPYSVVPSHNVPQMFYRLQYQQ